MLRCRIVQISLPLFCLGLFGASAQAQNLDPNAWLRRPGVKLLAVEFYATWCKPCIKAMPKLQEIYDQYSERGLPVVGVNEDGPRGQSKVKPFLRARKLTFPIALDPDGGLMKRMRVTALPTTLLVDRDGEVVFRQTGFTKGQEKQLVEAIEAVLPPVESESEGSASE